MQRTFGLLVLFSVAGCGDNNPMTTAMDMAAPPPEQPLCSKRMPAGAMPSQAAGAKGDLANAAACTEATSAIVPALADDIVPAGYVKLGPAVSFSLAAPPAFPHGLDVVIPADLAKGPSGAAATAIVVVGKRATTGTVAIVPASNVLYEATWTRLHFNAPELGTFQAAVKATAGQKHMRHFTYRAIGGASMGGMGSSLNFWSQPSLYDGVAVFGADPGPSLTYTLGSFRDWFFGGFCTADDAAAGRGAIGAPPNADGTPKCPPTRKAIDPWERPFDFEHMPYQQGEGTGLTSNRAFFIKALRDVSKAFHNPFYPGLPNAKTPFSTYLPPGVPTSVLTQSPSDLCAHPIVLNNYFDRRYNPDGSKPVITFCDGGNKPDPQQGVFDPSQPQNDPVQIALAVDVNGNGVRDAGEPVIVQNSERWDDVGLDGLPDAKEPGYDPVANPDPNHDDYHWFWNPTGTEGNWRFDQAGGQHEPFDDFGTDGVKGKGCALGTKDGCYDFGEGNGVFDYSPNLSAAFGIDPHNNALDTSKWSDDALARVDTYYDAGIHDFMNNSVSTNVLMGALEGRGINVRVWEGFPALVERAPSDENHFNVTDVDFAQLGHHTYVRYGDPDASEAVVEATGDGRHVGSALQAVHRGQMLFYALSHIWPDGDYDVGLGEGRIVDCDDPMSPCAASDTLVAQNGRPLPYVVVLPPGYDDPGREAKTYPVVYLMHGLGMDPHGFAGFAEVAQSAMANSSVPPEQRVQKMIMVMADAKCRPGGDVRDGSLMMGGDFCEEGAYYSDHPDGTYLGQTQLLELQRFIESKYRVRAAADVEVSD